MADRLPPLSPAQVSAQGDLINRLRETAEAASDCTDHAIGALLTAALVLVTVRRHDRAWAHETVDLLLDALGYADVQIRARKAGTS